MIRSRLANAFVLTLGLVLLFLCGAFGLAAIEEARRRSLDPSTVLPALVFLGLGTWCVRGSIVNFRRAGREPAPQSSLSLLAMRGLSVVLSSALALTLVGIILLARGHDGVMVEWLLMAAAATLAYGALVAIGLAIFASLRSKKTAA